MIEILDDSHTFVFQPEGNEVYLSRSADAVAARDEFSLYGFKWYMSYICAMGKRLNYPSFITESREELEGLLKQIEAVFNVTDYVFCYI